MQLLHPIIFKIELLNWVKSLAYSLEVKSMACFFFKISLRRAENIPFNKIATEHKKQISSCIKYILQSIFPLQSHTVTSQYIFEVHPEQFKQIHSEWKHCPKGTKDQQ